MTGAIQARVPPPVVSWSPEAANKLRNLAIEGLLALPKRGIEIGGLLLGSVSERAPYLVSVEDVCPIESEHRSGPAFILSDADQIRLDELLARTRGFSEHFVIGYYRSRTAPGALPDLDQTDRELIGRYFDDPSHIFIAVRPWSTRRCAATLYFWSGGELQTAGTTFELGGEQTPPAPPMPVAAPVQEPEPVEEKIDHTAPPAKPRQPFDTAWYSSLAFVLSMAGLFVADLPARHPCVAPLTQAAVVPPIEPAITPQPGPPAKPVEAIRQSARLLESPEPVISEAIRNRIENPVEIDVRVNVGAQGQVISAEPARVYPDGLHSYLAQQASLAARSARYRPAITASGSTAASTETISFNFAPR